VQEFRGPCATRRPAPEADGSRVKRTSRTGSYRSPSRSAPKNKRRPGYVRRIKNKCFPRPHPRTGLRGGRRHRAARRFHGHGSTRVPPRMQIRRISGARRKKDEERAPRDPILDFPASTSQPRLPSPAARRSTPPPFARPRRIKGFARAWKAPRPGRAAAAKLAREFGLAPTSPPLPAPHALSLAAAPGLSSAPAFPESPRRGQTPGSDVAGRFPEALPPPTPTPSLAHARVCMNPPRPPLPTI
jgi:hypothetical protein